MGANIHQPLGVYGIHRVHSFVFSEAGILFEEIVHQRNVTCRVSFIIAVPIIPGDLVYLFGGHNVSASFLTLWSNFRSHQTSKWLRGHSTYESLELFESGLRVLKLCLELSSMVFIHLGPVVGKGLLEVADLVCDAGNGCLIPSVNAFNVLNHFRFCVDVGVPGDIAYFTNVEPDLLNVVSGVSACASSSYGFDFFQS